MEYGLGARAGGRIRLTLSRVSGRIGGVEALGRNLRGYADIVETPIVGEDAERDFLASFLLNGWEESCDL